MLDEKPEYIFYQDDQKKKIISFRNEALKQQEIIIIWELLQKWHILMKWNIWDKDASKNIMHILLDFQIQLSQLQKNLFVNIIQGPLSFY